MTAYSDGENTETYLYDTLGNRTAKHLNGSPAAAYQYNAFSQLTSVTQGEDVYSYHYDRRGNLTEERHGDQVLKNYVYDAANRMISGTNLVTGRKSEYTYNGLLARVKKASDAIVSTYIPDYISGIIGGAFGFAGSALSQLAEGKGFNARKAWGAAANGAIVGAARGALTGSGVGIPAALGVNFAAGMAGSLAEQKLAGERMSPMRAAVDGAFNALGGRIYGTSPLRNAKDAFIRGALEGAVKGGAYNIADVLDNKLRNAYGPKKPAVRKPQNLRGVQPTRSRCPQQECEKARPFAGMNYPRKNGRGGSFAPRNDRFSLGRFVRDVAVGAVMGGLASVAFYGAGKGVEALRNSVRRKIRKPVFDGSLSLVFGNNDKAISDTAKIVLPTTREKFVVIGHGDPEGIMINGKVEKAWEVAVRVRNSEEFIGGRQIVQLYCCETGKYSNGFAQQLADILGVTVKAPNKKVYPLNGRVVVGYKYKDAITGINKWDPGDWIEFIPKTIILRRKGR